MEAYAAPERKYGEAHPRGRDSELGGEHAFPGGKGGARHAGGHLRDIPDRREHHRSDFNGIKFSLKALQRQGKERS